ncbi:MAG TPA: STAS domain-containing protein [Candidatus Baltobacteraceae bacterium]|jgi:anti-anti-sigma factor
MRQHVCVVDRINYSTSPLVVIRETLPNVEVLHVFGDADIATASELESSINEIDGSLPLIVDLSECRFIDTTAISVLIRAFRRLGDKFRIVVAPKSHVERVLNITHLPAIMSVSTSLEEAFKVA